MPKRTDIQKILLIGSGPIVIGQAAEFDYSGVQACKVLLEEGYEVVLVNSNPATIMTDPEFATSTYIEPLLPGPVTRIIEKERPDALLPTLGGQTALNLAMALHEDGTLERFGVELIGADAGGDPPRRGPRGVPPHDDRGGAADPLVDDRREPRRGRGGTRRRPHHPAGDRPPAFTMGGQGGGVGATETELRQVVSEGLAASPINQVLVEESVIGWGEFELEVMRDRNDNVVIICSIENVDPMGVHTGDSVTVAPAQTLTDPLYQDLRDQAIAVIRAIGVETGGSNVQFAVNPENGEIVVIEMNPRVSRSSALASKATGFPIAKMAAKLAVGYALEEIPNDITRADAGLLRADDRLRRDQDPALCLREVPRRGRAALDPHAERRRGDGDRPHLPRVLRQGDALARARLRAPRSRQATRRCSIASRSPAPSASTWILEAFGRGIDVEAVHERCLVDRWFLRELRGAGRRRRRHRGPGPHLQGGRHLRRRVRGGDALLLLRPRAALGRRSRRRRSAAASATRWSSSAPGPTGSARGSSSTTAACTRR